jgi:RNA polymerase sigma-70 factor (ECF subfamily)
VEEQAVATAHRRAAARWPGVALGLDAFRSRLATAGGPPERLCTDDVYLVGAVLEGDPRALRYFDAELQGRLGPVWARLRVSSDVIDEVRQRLRDRLLLPRPDRPPRLATYDGRGALVSWLRVVAAREALALAGQRDHASALADEALADALADDPEIELLKQTYRRVFADAFAWAVDELEPRQRTALRLHHVDALTLEQTAQVLGVHRATAARCLASARTRLLSRTRRRMMDSLRVDPDRLDSIMHLIVSRFDVSVSRMLQTEGPS